MKTIQLIVIIICTVLFPTHMWGQMNNAISVSNANSLAQMMAGPGVTVSNAGFFGQCDSLNSSGKFYATPNTVFGLDSGIVLTSGRVTTVGTGIGVTTPLATSPGTTGSPLFASNNTNGGSDADLVVLGNLGTISINDACVLEFDFVPLGDSVKFQYVFGSEEYTTFNCSINDIFGFFISGPGITGPYSGALNAANIALIPGTNYPVAISTINNGAGATPGNSCYNNTGGNGPFTNLYVSNIDSFNAGIQTGMSYTGFSKTLTALALVQPCSTYHLKLAVGDASDNIYDTGVFLKAGSLSSNSISFTPISNLTAPYPYIVEGCAAGYVKVKRPVATGASYTVNYQLGGSASAADYMVTTIPTPSPAGQVIIAPNDTVAYISFVALQDFIPENIEEIKIYQLAPCSNNIVDSSSLFISDTIHMHILTSDTSICAEDSLKILVNGSDSLNYIWSPASNINNSLIKEPKVSPNINTQYIVCASLPNSGCAPKCDTIQVNVNQPPAVKISNDTIICKNMSVQFSPSITPVQSYTYNWSGSGAIYLNSTTIPNPVGQFTAQGTYQLILKADPIAVGCEGMDTITITVLPDDIILHNQDTIVCKGASFQINVTGHPLFSYSWMPTDYLNNPYIEDPISTPDTSIQYTVVATYPGCPMMSKSFYVDVQPVPNVFAGPDRAICQYDTLQLHALVNPATYPNYIYTWSPFADLDNGNVANPIFSGMNSQQLQLIVSTPIGCADTDYVNITVNSVNFANVTPQQINVCPNKPVSVTVGGGVAYHWVSPNYGIDDTLSNTPVINIFQPTQYQVHVLSPQGCTDTLQVDVNVNPSALVSAGDDLILYPGEDATLYADGNCSKFIWTPDYHINGINTKNPIVSPPVTTQYVVKGETEDGCESTDTITIRISPESILDLPNAFSPGSGTSINDEIKIIRKGDATLNYFRIFNRWGEVVFETKDINKGWNGQYNGKPQPVGAYVYVIDAVTSTGRRFYKQGNITLFR